MPYSFDQIRQLAMPNGRAGVEMLGHLNKVNEGINRATLDVVAENPGIDILELGFGGGALIREGMHRLSGCHFTGADISHLAVDEAKYHFAPEIRSGRVSFTHLLSQDLPFDDTSFDTILSVNVIYFVRDLLDQCQQVHRILRGGGRYIVTHADESPDGRNFASDGISALLFVAGFDEVVTRTGGDDENGTYHIQIARKL